MKKHFVIWLILGLLIAGCGSRGYHYIPSARRYGVISNTKDIDDVVDDAKKETSMTKPDTVKASQKSVITPDTSSAPVGSPEAMGFYYIEPRKLSFSEIDQLNRPVEPVQTEPRKKPSNNGLVGEFFTGVASYYNNSLHGNPTASGEKYDMHDRTAAHRTLPFGTICEVTNTKNGMKVQVRINDRGPFSKGRVIDLSYRAMFELEGIKDGLITIKAKVVK